MKANKNRFILGIAAILLTVSSCNNLSENILPEENLSKNAPTIKVTLSDTDLRAAFPDIKPAQITTFTLQGSREYTEEESEKGEIISINKTWETDNETSAYQKMTGEIIPISYGNWTFSLSAIVKENDVTLASYLGVKNDFTVDENAESNLSFTLVRQSVNVAEEAGSGDLKIEITLGNALSSSVKKMTGKLKKLDGSIISDEAEFSENTYTVPDVPAGLYLAEIRFYGDDEKTLLMGTYPEAVNINSLGSYSKIKVDNLDRVYNLTYKAACFKESGFTTFGTNTNPAKYTRTMKKNIVFERPTKEGYAFLRWIQIQANAETAPSENTYFDSTPVTGVNRNTVGDMTLCALFIPLTEAKPFTGMEITGLTNDTAKIGTTVTAMGKSGEETFEGTLTDFKWVGDYDNYALPDETSNQLEMNPKYYNTRRIKVSAKPKYMVTLDEEDPSIIKTFKEYDGDSVSSTGVDISKGTLEINETVITRLTATVFRSQSFGVAKDKLEMLSGSFRDANHPAWVYTKEDIDSITFFPGDWETGYSGNPTTAPATSGIVNYKIGYKLYVKNKDNTVFSCGEAYEIINVTNLFVNVKYEIPTAETENLPALDKDNDFAISYGKMKFKTTNDLMQYRIDYGEWKNISTSEFEVPKNDFKIYVKYKTVGTENESGYIGESGSYQLEDFNYSTVHNPENSNTGFGKKVKIKSVTITGNEKIGEVLTATVVPEYSYEEAGYNIWANGYGTISWVWKVGDVVVKDTDNSNHTGRTTLTLSDGFINNCLNKIITAEATLSSAKTHSTVNKESSNSGTIGDGNLTITGSAEVFYKNGEAILSGADLNKSNVSLTGFIIKNALNEDIALNRATGAITTLSPDKAPDSSGNITVNFKIKGYKENSVTIGIKVKPAAPDFSGGGSGGSGGSEPQLNVIPILDDMWTNIPYGHIRFMNREGQPQIAEFELSLDNTNWTAIEPNTEGNFIGTYDKAKGNSLFTPDDESETIYLRYKKKAVKPKDMDDMASEIKRAYYCETEGYWVNEQNEKIYNDSQEPVTDDEGILALGYTTITEASDGTGIQLYDSQRAFNYVGIYRAPLTITITTVNDGDIELEANNSALSVSVKNASGYSDFAWWVDGNRVQDVSGSSLSIANLVGNLKDKFVIRVEAIDPFGDYVSTTATITVQ